MDKRNNNYCGIPAKVRSYKALNQNEKYLFGVISYNATEQGYWLIHNEFLTNLFQVPAGIIAKWVYSLEEEGLISSTIIREKGKYLYSFVILFPFP